MVSSERSDVYLRIVLGNEGARVRTISETLRNIETLLAHIERQVRGTNKADAQWAWAETPVLEFTASANGVSAPELKQVVTEFRDGFERAREAREQRKNIQWPDSFDPDARKQVNKILLRLEELGSLAVKAEDLPEVFIDAAEVSELVMGTPRLRRVRSTVEGDLEVISRRGGLRASLKEMNSNNLVSITFSEDMKEKVKGLWDKRVLVEGMVNYRSDGSAISVNDVDYIEERIPGPPLSTFIGAAPDLTGGLSDEEFIAEMHDG